MDRGDWEELESMLRAIAEALEEDSVSLSGPEEQLLEIVISTIERVGSNPGKVPEFSETIVSGLRSIAERIEPSDEGSEEID